MVIQVGEQTHPQSVFDELGNVGQLLTASANSCKSEPVSGMRFWPIESARSLRSGTLSPRPRCSKTLRRPLYGLPRGSQGHSGYNYLLRRSKRTPWSLASALASGVRGLAIA